MQKTKTRLDINKDVLSIKKPKLINRKVCLLAGIVASLNVLFSKNYAISMAIITIELLILVYYFIKKDITKYVGSYLIFLCLSFEFDALVGLEQFYGFKNFRILGVNLGIIALLPILGLAMSRKIKIKEIKNKFPDLYKFSRAIILMNITGFMFGLFQILINDNKIQSMDGMLRDFIGVSYSIIAIPFLMIVAISYLLSWERNKLEQINNYLIAVLVGVVISMIVSLAYGNFGTYGGVKTLLAPNLLIYVPFMVLVPFYEKYKSEKQLIIIGTIGIVLSLIYNATGKTIIIIILIPIGIYGVLLKRKKVLPLAVLILLLPITLILGIPVIEKSLRNNILFRSKLDQVLSLLKFRESDWLLNMPLSPRVRIVEFINIIYEYLEKPWFFILGKGYMGTIKDYTGILTATFVSDAFSMNQWANGTFYGVHGTINVLFLYNGLFGFFFYLKMVRKVLINYTKDPWILIGGFWFLLFYGFSVTLSTFGITALLMGFIKLRYEETM